MNLGTLKVDALSCRAISPGPTAPLFHYWVHAVPDGLHDYPTPGCPLESVGQIWVWKMDLQSPFWQVGALLCYEHLGPLLPLW